MMRDYKSAAYDAEKQFAEETEIEMIDGLEKEVFNNLVRQDSRLMWDHEGVCPTCGKRTYLFSQCLDCLKNENDADEMRRSDAEREEDYCKEPEETDGSLQLGAVAPERAIFQNATIGLDHNSYIHL